LFEALHLRVTGYSNKEFDAIADEDYYHPDYLEYAHNKIKESVKYLQTLLFLHY
jgi:hypothetical protein